MTSIDYFIILDRIFKFITSCRYCKIKSSVLWLLIDMLRNKYTDFFSAIVFTKSITFLAGNLLLKTTLKQEFNNSTRFPMNLI